MEQKKLKNIKQQKELTKVGSFFAQKMWNGEELCDMNFILMCFTLTF